MTILHQLNAEHAATARHGHRLALAECAIARGPPARVDEDLSSRRHPCRASHQRQQATLSRAAIAPLPRKDATTHTAGERRSSRISHPPSEA